MLLRTALLALGALLWPHCTLWAQERTLPEQQQELPAASNKQVDAPEILTALFTPNTGVFRGLDFRCSRTMGFGSRDSLQGVSFDE